MIDTVRSEDDENPIHEEGVESDHTNTAQDDADSKDGGGKNPDRVEQMYKNWYLEYASYVILDRAVPYASDGLKPVQRRILHALWELEDGRFHKVANVIGHTMKYHPHGDAAINDALVNLGQKELLLDIQGNWGNVVTGDSAAAPRYIEVRLSKFAKEILFNEAITHWQSSYDGRSREPIHLPVRFPLLLALGVEGIAVGLATKILPHNFNELIQGAINYLRGKKVNLYPDFPTGGIADVSEYKGGERGGRVKIRAKIEVLDKKTLKISEIPFGTTTTSLIESIVAASEKGKIKIRKVEDNTARDVEILIHLQAGGDSPQQVIDALYAFTDCESSLAPNCCIISENKPEFITVNELLARNTEHTKELIRLDLQHQRSVKLKRLHFATLEKIFISKRIYRVIEDCESWEEILKQTALGLKPYQKLFIEELTNEDLEKLTEIRLKRISRFDSKKADDDIVKLKQEIKLIEDQLANLNDHVIEYFERMLKDYGQGRNRRTTISEFATISKASVAKPDKKIYMNAKDGFVGTSLRKDQYLFDCSEIDEIIAFTQDGKFTVFQPEEKLYVGKDIIYVHLYVRGDTRTTYHLIYRDGPAGASYAKRFTIPSITRNKLYELTKETAGSEVIYFSVHPHGEAEKVRVSLYPKARVSQKEFVVNFADMPVRARTVVGDKISDYAIQKVEQVSVGKSTLAAEKIYFDSKSFRLTKEETEQFLGEFSANDRIVAVYQSGTYEVTDFKLNNSYGSDLIFIHKLDRDIVLSAVYYDGNRDAYYLKRFEIPSELTKERQSFLPAESSTRLNSVSISEDPKLQVQYFTNRQGLGTDIVDVKEFVEIRKMTALGNKLSDRKLKKVEFMPD